MKKNICLITSNLNVFGGAQRVCVNLANEFVKHGYKVKVISLELCDRPVYELRENIEYDSIKRKLRGREVLKPAIFWKLRKIYKTFSADIIMVIGSGATLGSVPALGTKASIIVCEHCAYKNKFEQGRKNFINRYIGLKYADKIVTLTRDNMEECVKKFHIDARKVTYIYNFAPDYSDIDIKYNTYSKKLITVGRIEPVKGYDMLVDIAERVFQNNPEWSWDIYGDVEDEVYFRQVVRRIEEKRLTDKIHFCGHSNNLHKLFSQYAMYIMTSYHEGLPMVLLEAKSAGLPLVSFDIATGPNEIIEDGVNGKLIPAYDIEKMAKCIDKLIKNEKERIRLSSGAEVLKEKYSKENIMNKWIELIESI